MSGKVRTMWISDDIGTCPEKKVWNSVSGKYRTSLHLVNAPLPISNGSKRPHRHRLAFGTDHIGLMDMIRWWRAREDIDHNIWFAFTHFFTVRIHTFLPGRRRFRFVVSSSNWSMELFPLYILFFLPYIERIKVKIEKKYPNNFFDTVSVFARPCSFGLGPFRVSSLSAIDGHHKKEGVQTTTTRKKWK